MQLQKVVVHTDTEGDRAHGVHRQLLQGIGDVHLCLLLDVGNGLRQELIEIIVAALQHHSGVCLGEGIEQGGEPVNHALFLCFIALIHLLVFILWIIEAVLPVAVYGIQGTVDDVCLGQVQIDLELCLRGHVFLRQVAFCLYFGMILLINMNSLFINMLKKGKEASASVILQTDGEDDPVFTAEEPDGL